MISTNLAQLITHQVWRLWPASNKVQLYFVINNIVCNLDSPLSLMGLGSEHQTTAEDIEGGLNLGCPLGYADPTAPTDGRQAHCMYVL
jgi:hypothetical protein